MCVSLCPRFFFFFLYLFIYFLFKSLCSFAGDKSEDLPAHKIEHKGDVMVNEAMFELMEDVKHGRMNGWRDLDGQNDRIK